MRCPLAIVLCLLAAMPARAELLSGYWCGIAEQTNPDGTRSFWTAHMLLRGAEGHMEYPSLDCGGPLTFERTENGVHFYRERIAYGRDRCIDGGLIAVAPAGTSVRWEWTGSDVKASALLSSGCPERPGNASLKRRCPSLYPASARRRLARSLVLRPFRLVPGVVMVGLVPTIHPTACSGVRGWLDPRDKPEDDSGYHLLEPEH
jgi:hypothetical protein